jgi:hypothetical protein
VRLLACGDARLLAGLVAVKVWWRECVDAWPKQVRLKQCERARLGAHLFDEDRGGCFLIQPVGGNLGSQTHFQHLTLSGHRRGPSASEVQLLGEKAEL